MKHNCSALILHCIDFRFGPKIQEWLHSKSLVGDLDTVSVAGAAKNIVAPHSPNDREFIIRQCGISKRLHDIQEVILMNHTDCGAYGGRNAFPDRDIERASHMNDLREAGKILRQEFPNLRVKLALADIEPSGEINVIEEA